MSKESESRAMRILAIILLLLALPAPTRAVEISNLRWGLACRGSAKGQGDGWICHQAQDVFVTDQGRCVYDGETLPCTWIGFEFDYAGAGDGAKLQCTDATSEPTTSGNPGKELAKNVSSEQFELALDGAGGHYFNPMYWIFETRPAGRDIVETYTCRSGGAVVFEAKFNLHFPADKAVASAPGASR
jgi:hypothetical protein